MRDPLLALGQVIREQREAKAWSIEDFARESRLSPKFISAIEEGRRDELPEEAFLMGFLNIAAKTLKLDPQAIDKYKDKEASFILETIINDENPAKIPASYRYRPAFFRIYHLYILAALLVLSMIGIWAFQRIQAPVTKVQAPAPSLISKVPKATNGEVLSLNTQAKTIKGKHRLTLKAKQRAWLQVIALGANNILFEGYIDSKTGSLSFADDLGLFLSASNAAAFEIDIGRGYYKLGAQQQNIKFYYPPSAKMRYKDLHGSIL